jgi:hypothetical protein
MKWRSRSPVERAAAVLFPSAMRIGWLVPYFGQTLTAIGIRRHASQNARKTVSTKHYKCVMIAMPVAG